MTEGCRVTVMILDSGLLGIEFAEVMGMVLDVYFGLKVGAGVDWEMEMQFD